MQNDAISRSALLDRINYYVLHSMGSSQYAYKVIQKEVATAPDLDVAPVVHAHWIRCKGKSQLWHCSACGKTMIYNQNKRTYNIEKKPMHELNRFCRSCGAIMDATES